ncbi:hypothetical protein [Methylocystis sp. ATCC 49242]|nr:hypothetical protein [Methylocystis sp. ATCC 49242]
MNILIALGVFATAAAALTVEIMDAAAAVAPSAMGFAQAGGMF